MPEIALCLDKYRDKNGIIIGYKLETMHGFTVTKSAKEVKDYIKNNRVYVVNLTLTSDGRLVDRKPSYTKEFPKPLEIPTKEELDTYRKKAITAARYIFKGLGVELDKNKIKRDKNSYYETNIFESTGFSDRIDIPHHIGYAMELAEDFFVRYGISTTYNKDNLHCGIFFETDEIMGYGIDAPWKTIEDLDNIISKLKDMAAKYEKDCIKCRSYKKY